MNDSTQTAGRVLVVEDDEQNRRVLKQALEPYGYELLMARDGREALPIIKEHRPDVVLLDIMIPGRDGFELCRLMRVDRALAAISVIMITGYQDRDTRLRGIACGANDFLTKPLDVEDVALRIGNGVRMKRFCDDLLQRNRDAEALAENYRQTAERYRSELMNLTSEMSHKLREITGTMTSYLEQQTQNGHSAGYGRGSYTGYTPVIDPASQQYEYSGEAEEAPMLYGYDHPGGWDSAGGHDAEDSFLPYTPPAQSKLPPRQQNQAQPAGAPYGRPTRAPY